MLRFALAILFLAACSPATTRPAPGPAMHGQVASSHRFACRYDGPNDPGFCDVAPANANPIDHPSDFFVSHASNGVRFLGGAHPPDFNLPGIDFPVGITSPKSALTPASRIHDQIPDCYYDPASSRVFNGPGPAVFCKAAGATTTIDIEGYDFTGVWIEVAANPVGDNRFIFKNNALGGCPQCVPARSIGDFLKIEGGNVCVDVDIESNTWTGPGRYGNVDDIADNVSCGSQKLLYNKFLYTPGRIMSGPWGMKGGAGLPAGHADFLFCANYVEGMIYQEGQEHGEINEFGSLSAFSANSVRYCGNTLYEPTSTYGLTGWTWGSGNQKFFTSTFNNWRFDHNVAITQPNKVTGKSSGGLVRFDGDVYVSPRVDHNWLYPGGTYFCIAAPLNHKIRKLSIAGNINLASGQSWNAIDGRSGICPGAI